LLELNIDSSVTNSNAQLDQASNSLSNLIEKQDIKTIQEPLQAVKQPELLIQSSMVS